jgi:hypothetical protein
MNTTRFRQLLESTLGDVKPLISEETSDETCSFNVKSDVPSEIEQRKQEWENLPESNKSSIENSIKSQILQVIKRCVKDYIQWYSKEDTIKKFSKGGKDNIRVRKVFTQTLPTYLNAINKVELTTNPHRAGVIAWVRGDTQPYTINYTLQAIHDTKDFLESMSIYEVTKHEMAHLIDSYLRKNNIVPYSSTGDFSTPEKYQKNYIINDKDQYSRLSYLRGIIGAEPMDGGKELLNKFMSAVNGGKISSPRYEFSTKVSPITSEKNTTDDANKMVKYFTMGGGIVVGKAINFNIIQLFSTFSFYKDKQIWVNFSLIGRLNVTSAKVDNVSPEKDLLGTLAEQEKSSNNYYLILSPKKGVVIPDKVETKPDTTGYGGYLDDSEVLQGNL